MTAETSNARGEWVLVPRVPTEEMEHEGIGVAEWTGDVKVIWSAMLAAAPPPAAARGDVRGLEYVPGRLDREAPARVWLQIDTTGDNDERDDAWPGPEHVTWQDESIGGLEIQYVRADLALAAEGVQAGEVEQRARELLADAYAAAGFPESASDVRKGRNNYGALERASLSAIAAALSQQPEAQDMVDETLPEFLERIATEIEARDTLPGSFAEGLATSLRGRAYIVRATLTGERNG